LTYLHRLTFLEICSEALNLSTNARTRCRFRRHKKAASEGGFLGPTASDLDPDFQLQPKKPVNRFKNLAIACDEPA